MFKDDELTAIYIPIWLDLLSVKRNKDLAFIR